MPSRSSPSHGSTLHSDGVGQHGVDMAGQASSGPRDSPRRRAIRFGRSVVGPEQLALEAGGGQPRAQELLCGPLVARRVDGVEADQLLQQLDRLLAEVKSP